MRVLDLFSGIGGMSLGLEMAGPFETVAFCEREPYCRAVLEKHWPGVPIHEDVRTLSANHGLGGVDLVAGGYPCQPFSHAGKRAGEEDDRHLWPEMLRLIREIRPSWVLGENVSGHITLGLDYVLSDLEAAGYAAQPFVVPAVAVDAPHRRDRVWIVAHTHDSIGPLEPEGRISDVGGWLGDGGNEVASADTNSAGLAVGVGGADRQAAIRATQRQDRGRGARWLPEPGVGRVATRVSARVDRLRALGNAVVPQVVAEIGRAILAAEAEHAATSHREAG